LTRFGLCLALLGCVDADALDRCFQRDCHLGVGCIPEARAGWSHTCARKADGSVWCWGNNNAAELGPTTGSVPWRPVPATVAGLEGATRIATSDSHTCAILGSGGITCWGYDSDGQLGSVNAMGQLVAVPGIAAAQWIAAGELHTCAASGADGNASCWGANEHGQLGDGSTTAQAGPVTVAGLLDVAQVAVGYTHSCALKHDGTIWCWGENTNGQLGDGTLVDRPTAAPARLSDAIQLAAGFHQTCAVTRDGALWCWGLNSQGQLGDGTRTDRALPVRVVGLLSIAEVSLNGYDTFGLRSHSCARGTGGAVWCWGGNTFGEIGDGTTVDRTTPTRVPTLAQVVTISAGQKHTCAVGSDASVSCWGANDVGQLGDGSFIEAHQPVRAMLYCP
jgi:hypothetical protein